jgi:hypothetical protein
MTGHVRPSGPAPSARRACAWLALLSGALAVRALWLPAVERHGWEGHEAEYLAVFQGTWDGPWSTRVVPLLGWTYRALGRLGDGEGLLLALSLGLGLFSLAALVVLVRREAGPLAGWLAGALAAVYGNHAFWSSSAYNVIAPHAMLLAGLAAAGSRGPGGALASGLCLGAAVGARLELVALLPAALPLLRGLTWRRWLLWAGALLAVSIPSALPVLAPGAHPTGLVAEVRDALAMNLWPPLFLAPWSDPVPLGAALLLAGVGTARSPRAAASLWLLLLLGHASAAAFSDSGFRHALAGGVALSGLSALGLSALWQSVGTGPSARRTARAAAVALLGLLLATLLLDTGRIAARYYAPAAPLVADLASANPAPFDPASVVGCRVLCTSPARLPGEDGPLDVARRVGCWTWEEDWQHLRWTSLGVHDRALRVHRLFAPRALGMRAGGTNPDRPQRQVWRIDRP